MDIPAELTALNITPQGALLRWNPPLSSVDNYVLTLTHNQGKSTKKRHSFGWKIFFLLLFFGVFLPTSDDAQNASRDIWHNPKLTLYNII